MQGIRKTGFALAAALALSAITAAGASALVVQTGNGRLLGIALKRGVSATSLPSTLTPQGNAGASSNAASNNGNLNYHGGPVLNSTAPYLIFWDPSGTGIAASSRGLLERYFTDVAADSGKASNVYSVDWQYTDASGDAAGKATQFGAAQAISDTQPFPALASGCATAATYPNCVTDTQLQAEIKRLIASQQLPAGTGPDAPIYFVVTPGNTNICSGTSCASNTFCAFHSDFTDGGSDVLYATIPLFFDGASSTQNPKNCQDDGNTAVQQPNGDPADVAIKYLSHEDNETITDPLINAWYNTADGNEDGDNCNFFGSFSPSSGTNPNAFTPTLGGSASAGTLYNQLINGHQYYIQSEWSNAVVNCRLTASAITASVNPSSIAADGHSTSTATATVTNAGVPVTGANVSFTSSDAGETIGAVTDHGDGTYTATITASQTVGTATITATDNSTNPPVAATTTLTQARVPTIKVAFKSTSIIADGHAQTVATATVTLNGLAVNGATITFTSTDTGETIGPVTASGSGKYSATITASHTVGSAVITAHDGGTSGSATLKQVAPSIRVALKPTSIAANGSSTSVVTATVLQGLTGINGDTIKFTSSDPGESIGPVTNAGGGKYTATITASSTVGTATIRATDTSVQPSPSATATLKQT